MCTLTDNINNIYTVRGYKIVLKIEDKYFSPTTGIEYKVGQVTIPTYQNNIIGDISSEILDKRSIAYNEHMVGRTCVLLDHEDAKNILEYWKGSCKIEYLDNLIIVSMAIGDELMFGGYGVKNVVGGKYIYGIDEI
jgi:hypothetical protein